MIKITVLCLAILSSQCLVLASTQEPTKEEVRIKVERFASKVDKAVRERKGGWLLQKKIMDGNYALSEWTIDKKYMRASINYYPSVEKAAKDMELAPGSISSGLGEKLNGLGDEAYVWRWNEGETQYRVQFRKSNIIVIVHASAVSDGEELARSVASSLTAP